VSLVTIQKLPADTAAREKFFASCLSVECKKAMLGPYQDLFTPEEISGHTDQPGLDPQDPVNQNYLNGYSAAVLYRKLLQKIKHLANEKKMTDPWIEPWSGKPAQIPPSLSEMSLSLMDRALTSVGISNTQCLDPEVVMKMRCYAVGMVLDPMLLLSGAGALADILEAGGLIGRASEATARLGKAENILGRSLSADEQAAILQAHEVGAGEIGRDGQTAAAVGNYSDAQLREKAQILKEAGLPATERRTLIENSVVGAEPVAASTVPRVSGLSEAASSKMLESLPVDTRARVLKVEQQLKNQKLNEAQATQLIQDGEKQLSNTLKDKPEAIEPVKNTAQSLVRIAQSVLDKKRPPLTGDQLVALAKNANARLQNVTPEQVLRQGSGITRDTLGRRVAYVAPDSIAKGLGDFAKWYDGLR
jgi:hypothetical protein